jgi:hypothetical protein
MSLTLSVASSTTLSVTNIPITCVSLTFSVSVDGGTTYSTLTSVPSSPISITLGTTAYSLTNTLVPNYYYRVTDNTNSTTSTPVQYTPQFGRIALSQNWRLNIQSVTGTSLTSGTTPSISTVSYGTYYSITNSGFNQLTLPSPAPAALDGGAFWVLRNNTSIYLSITVTNPGTLASPLVIPPSNSVTIIWNGSAYVLF